MVEQKSKYRSAKLRLRKWKLLEVTPLDEEDEDFEGDVDLRTWKTKKHTIRQVVDVCASLHTLLSFDLYLFTCIKFGWLNNLDFLRPLYKEQKLGWLEVEDAVLKKIRPHRVPREPACESKVSKCKDLIENCHLSPELDTVRVYYDCGSFVDLDKFIADSSRKYVYSCGRGPDGNIAYAKEYFRSEMKCSWWGTMVVSKEVRRHGENGCNSRPVLSFEFSVAKWWHYASGVNSGDEPCADLILVPCCQAMKVMGIHMYATKSLEAILTDFVENAELRRSDLSLNFKVPEKYTATEYVQIIQSCRINQQSAKIHDDGSISFATEKSPYRCIFYDKEKECKNFYLNTCKKDEKNVIYFQDADGVIHDKQNFDENGKPVYEEKVYNERKLKRNFYEKNKHHFKNNLRFEVQFRTKFFQEHNLMTTGRENIDNCIRLMKFYWMDLLDQIDEQLGRRNFDPANKEPVAELIEKIREDIRLGEISRTKGNNMMGFVLDCYRDWKAVKADIGRDLFSKNKKALKERYNYDVCIKSPLPIMRIMSQFMIDRRAEAVQDYRLIPASPVQLAV